MLLIMNILYIYIYIYILLIYVYIYIYIYLYMHRYIIDKGWYLANTICLYTYH